MNKEQGNPGVTKAQLEKLMHNYRSKVKKVRKGSTQSHDHDPKIDSKSAWFSREAIEELFNVNNADGVRIYFCVHDTDIMPTPYDDKLTVVLVATKNINGKTEDQLFDRAGTDQTEVKSLMMASKKGLGAGTGLNHASICPPSC